MIKRRKYHSSPNIKGLLNFLAVILILTGLGLWVSGADVSSLYDKLTSPSTTGLTPDNPVEVPGCVPKDLNMAMTGDVTVKDTRYGLFSFRTVITGVKNLETHQTLSIGQTLFGKYIVTIKLMQDGRVVGKWEKEVTKPALASTLTGERKVPFYLRFTSKDYNCDGKVDPFTATLYVKIKDDEKVTEMSKNIRYDGFEVIPQ